MGELNCYIHYDEYDYNHERPLLVIQSDMGSVGYNLDKDTGEVDARVCICYAHNENECVCGAWCE